MISLRKFSILTLLCCWYQQISYAMPQKELDIINTGSFVIDCRMSTYADGKKFVWNNTLMQHNDYVYEKVTGLQQLGKNVNYGGSVKRVVYAPFEYGSIKKILMCGSLLTVMEQEVEFIIKAYIQVWASTGLIN